MDLAQQLVQQAPDGIIFADPSGTIRIWNAAAERIFGFAAKDAVGANLDIIVPEDLRAAHWRGFEAALANRQTKYKGKALSTKAMRADGTRIYVELSFGVILGSHGDALGALAQARDITERYVREREERRKKASG
ncbi:MAG: PAS domain S-box protein [Gammaproteobacteria bacterium]